MFFRLNLKPRQTSVDERVISKNEKITASGEEPQDLPGIFSDSKDETENYVVTKEFQRGVQRAQAITQVWGTRDLVLAYVLMWIIQLVQAYSYGIVSTLTPYVTSSFQQHSLTATTSIIANLIGGLVKLPYAKLIDIWGRPQGLTIMVGSITLGLVMMAGCNNVQIYCAAQVFYMLGYTGIDFTMTIFIADTSKLRNRAFMIAFASSPYLATIWAYGPTAQSILGTIGFRWGFGIWAVIYLIACTPLFALLYLNQKKAEKAGLLPVQENRRTLMESVLYYAKEFDFLGLLLLTLGLSLFLLSFSLYSYQKKQWRAPLIISFIVIGGLLVIAFAFYEKFFALVTFMPFELLTNRTVFFTYTMVASLYTAFFIWDSYYYSFLIVVNKQSISHATYITNIYTIGSCCWALVMGVVIRYNGHLKWQALYFGVPITALGVALMIKFRQPDTNIGYMVMCQIFVAFGGGTLVICEQMTIMAVSLQQNIPAVLAMEGMIANIGSAVGETIATAMWTGIFLKKLAQLLPPDAQADLSSIYGSLEVQTSYAVGTPTRNAIDLAYGDTQRLMLIVATSLYSITLVSTMLWKEVNVKGINQVSGRVV